MIKELEVGDKVQKEAEKLPNDKLGYIIQLKSQSSNKNFFSMRISSHLIIEILTKL